MTPQVISYTTIIVYIDPVSTHKNYKKKLAQFKELYYIVTFEICSYVARQYI